MFGSILILTVTLTHIYTFWRASSVPLFKRLVPRKILFGAGVILWSTFFFGRILGHSGIGAMAGLVEMFGMTWMGVLFLITVSLLAMELITGFGFFLPRKAPTLRGLALFIGGALSVAALIQGMRPPVVDNYAVNLSGLPGKMDGTVIIAVSDLHLGSQLGKEWLEARLAQVREQRPDLVVLLEPVLEQTPAGLRRAVIVLGAPFVHG